MRAEVAEREFPGVVCCCVEKAALHIEVVTVEIGRKVKTKRGCAFGSVKSGASRYVLYWLQIVVM